MFNPRTVLLFLCTRIALGGQKPPTFMQKKLEPTDVKQETDHGLPTGTMTSDLQGHSRSKVKNMAHDHEI